MTDLSTWLILIPAIFIILSIFYALYKFGSPSPNVDDDEEISSKENVESLGLRGKKRKGRITEEGNGSERTGLLDANGDAEDDNDNEKIAMIGSNDDGNVNGKGSLQAWGLDDEDDEEIGNLSQVSIATRNGQVSPSRDRFFSTSTTTTSNSNPNPNVNKPQSSSHFSQPKTPSKLSKHSYTQSSPSNHSNLYSSSSSRHSSSNSLSNQQVNSDPANESFNSRSFGGDSPWRAINLSSTKRGAIHSSHLNPSGSRDSVSSLNGFNPNGNGTGNGGGQTNSERKLAGTKAKTAAVAPPVRNNSGSRKGESSKDE